MVNFSTPVSIVNRGLQRLGANRITALTDPSKQAKEAAACYDNLRRAELRRNNWRSAIRRVILRAVGTAFPTWDSAVTYIVGSFVTYGGINYISIHVTNLNKEPDTQPTYWSVFTGNTSQKVTPSAWAIGTTYAAGAIVTGTDNLFYLSMQAANLAHDPTTDTTRTYWEQYVGNIVASAYDSTITYNVGELVFNTSNAVYYSTANNNANAPSTGIGWATIACTVSPLVIPWPVGTGPVTETQSKNLFVLPYGFLRQASQDPRGNTSWFPVPAMTGQNWLLEGNYLIADDASPIVFRFTADISQVALMDDLFCEMLGNRIAYELCETLTNSNTKQTAIGQEYTEFRRQAAAINAIENGSDETPEDDWVLCKR